MTGVDLSKGHQLELMCQQHKPALAFLTGITKVNRHMPLRSRDTIYNMRNREYGMHACILTKVPTFDQCGATCC